MKQLSTECLAAEAVEGAALALERVDDVHGGDRLSAGVLGVCDGVTYNVLKEYLKDTTSLLVDESRDSLDTSSTSETTNGGLGNSLDIVSQDFSVTLGASLSESFSSFSSSRHYVLVFLSLL